MRRLETVKMYRAEGVKQDPKQRERLKTLIRTKKPAAWCRLPVLFFIVLP